MAAYEGTGIAGVEATTEALHVEAKVPDGEPRRLLMRRQLIVKDRNNILSEAARVVVE
jgi:hypothetical protein